MASEEILDYKDILLDSNRNDILWNDFSVLHIMKLLNLYISIRKNHVTKLDPSPRIARWLITVMDYKFKIVYRPRKLH
jgi:hypothetical protein